MNISQKKLSHVWLISPWLPKPVLRARLKHVLKSIKKEDAALKREGLENLQEEQLKAVSVIKKHCHCTCADSLFCARKCSSHCSLCCERHFLCLCMQSFSDFEIYGYLKIQKNTKMTGLF